MSFTANDFCEIVRTSLKHSADDMMREALVNLTSDELLWLECAARELYDDRAEEETDAESD